MDTTELGRKVYTLEQQFKQLLLRLQRQESDLRDLQSKVRAVKTIVTESRNYKG